MGFRSTSGRVRKTFLSALALLLAFTAGSVFVASGQQESNTYYGCLSGTGGLTRVTINETPTCPGAYTMISWNAEGVEGPVGPQGPQGIQGEPGLIWQGEWQASTTYAPDDAVSHLGSSYVALAETTGEEPGTGSSWDLLAAKGDQGIQGIQGIQGVQGVQGDTGDTGATGAAGISGYEVVTESITKTVAYGATYTTWLSPDCPDGKKILGGGGYQSPTYGDVRFSGPLYSGGVVYDSWYIWWTVRSDEGPDGGGSVTYDAFAICGYVN